MTINDHFDEKEETKSISTLIEEAHRMLREMDQIDARLYQLEQDLLPRTVYKDPDKLID